MTQGKLRLSEHLTGISLLPEYSTDGNDVVGELYQPCLSRSIRYDRAVGYFRSSIYRELGEELLDFAIRGGKIRIVCSPDIPIEDENAAREGYKERGKIDSFRIEATLVRILEIMAQDPDEKDCLEMLRVLIQNNSLELLIAIRIGGIFHRKLGRFTDSSGNFVVFSGSGNETQNAISRIEDWSNDEEFDVFRSWGDEFERSKAQRKSKYLNQLISGGTAHTKVRPLLQTESILLDKFRKYDNLEECRLGARKRSGKIRFFAIKKPYYYQTQAISAWIKANHVGVISMATGTGKTLTSLFAVKPLVLKGFPLLILVPTKVLLDQWQQPIREIFPDTPVLLAGAGNDWKKRGDKRIFISDTTSPRIILSTMDTASSKEFVEFINQAENLVLIADEVHRLGSEQRRHLLNLNFIAKLGLSATPERLFDDAGNTALANSFGVRPVFELPIGAKVKLDDIGSEIPILGKFLSKYYYDFEIVRLTVGEQEQWNQITERLTRYVSKSHNKNLKEVLQKNLNSTLKMMFIQRSRIAKNASGKVEAAEKIIKERYPPTGRWLVYCDNEAQMNDVWSLLTKSNPTTQILKYYSGMSYQERNRVLDQFGETPGIIVSIKCLDEGLDVPSADGAVILASSTNPREYIQRRGRVLRKYAGKGDVHIIDTIVLPASDLGDISFSLIKSELARAYLFSENSINKEITHDIWKICENYGIIEEDDAELSLEEDS